MEIFAHRGLLKKHPENSFTALAEAVRSEFGLEIDLRLTKDRDFAVIHDDTPARLTGVDKKVADLTLAEAENLQYLNSKEKVISLRRFLGWLIANPTSHKHAIHLKADSQTEIGLKLVAQYWKEFDMYHSAFVFDLTKEAASRLKEIDSRIKIALIVSDFKFEPTIYFWEEVKDFKPMDIVWSAEYRKLYSKEFIDEVKATGRTIYTMSPDVHWILGHPMAYEGHERAWDYLIAWGSEGICTDYPEKLARKLKTI